MGVLIAYLIILYAGIALPVFVVGRKLRVPQAWVAFIPLGWFAVLAWCDDSSWFNAIFVIIPVVGLFVYGSMWKRVAVMTEVNEWWCILAIIPFGGWIIALLAKPVHATLQVPA